MLTIELNQNIKKTLLCASVVFVALVAGCSSSPPATTKAPAPVAQPSFDSIKDSGPVQPVDVTYVPDAVPREVVRTIAGNKSPYTVLGKTYWVMPSSDNYKERGVASWYGRKFHGRNTSNGEPYDMYGMTAAHKTLPIPTYVKVTNLNNRKSVIVRVNDRGPFHDDRVIDLSYAAAQKLGFHNSGTAPVEVEAIDPATYHRQQGNSTATNVASNAKPATASNTSAAVTSSGSNPISGEIAYLQAGAFSSKDSADKLQMRLAGLVSYPVFVREEVAGSLESAKRLFKVRIGPLSETWQLLSVKETFQLNNLPVPLVVYD